MAIKIVNKTEQQLQYSVLQLPSQVGGFTTAGNLQAGRSQEVATPTTEGKYFVTGSVHESIPDGASVTFGTTVK